jgi:hypothetical protein
MPAFIPVARTPDAAPRWSGGTEFMIAAEFGAAIKSGPDAVDGQQHREHRVGEVRRDQHQAEEAGGLDEQPAGGEHPCPEPVGQRAGDRTGDQEPDGQRQHVDAGPEWGLVERIALQRQPDALQPDDQDELQAATGHRGQRW